MIFYVTGRKIRYKKSLAEALYEYENREENAASFLENDSEKILKQSQSAVGAWLNQIQNWSSFISNLTNPINKMFTALICLKNSTFLSLKIIVDKD